ncbi:hypothetical protein [Nocardioides sp. B-3]|uniref:hypothetical protein n=1 Tax=Nocardioides sp. B-3 TaxID=2895565 RepID=UPI002153A517|nr:hypothetical protein [Nocardioides sp. B-3]UUZ59384.1 hypothetical protein LP418_26825 [Nocardioides sp. B-3]
MRRLLGVGLLLLTLVAVYAALPLAVRVQTPVEPELPIDAGLDVPQFGSSGTRFLHYVHHKTIAMTVPVHNSSLFSITITAASIGANKYSLLEPTEVSGLPLRLGPSQDGEITVGLRFGNCRYYHERAITSLAGVTLEGDSPGTGLRPVRRLRRAVGSARPGDHGLPGPHLGAWG